MAENFEIYFHLGYPKVASTYFQKHIFPKLEGITFIPKHKYKKYKDIAGQKTSGKLLFSTEKDRKIVEAVKDIVNFYPSAKIILFVRRQDDWILSRYKYRIRKNGGEYFNEFFDLESNNGLWKQEHLFYRSTIEAIESICKDPPLVLSHDMLKENPENFISQLLSYMGNTKIRGKIHPRRTHTAFREKQLIVLRRFNKRFPYQKMTSPSRLRNKIHYKYREFILHIIAFLSIFIPRFFIKEKTLLTEAEVKELKQIRAFYKDDWEYCKAYMTK